MSEIITTTGRSIGTITTEIRIIKRQAEVTVLSSAIEIGRRLVEAKELVSHGEWGQYLQREVEFSQSTANNFMQLFKEYGNDQQSLFSPNSQALGNLNYTKALRLLALPGEEREAFVQENDVENMSTRELEKAIREKEDAVRKMELAQEERGNAEAAAEKARKATEEERQIALNMRARAEAAERKVGKVAELEAELEKAKEKEKKLKAEVKGLKENPAVPETVMEKLRKDAQAAAAEEARKAVEAQLAQAKEEARRAEEGRAAAQTALEAVQKSQKMNDPDILAIKTLSQQLMGIWNTMLGHKQKAVLTSDANKVPLEAFLKKTLEAMQQGLG